MPYQNETTGGARILICENELLFAEDMAITLSELGYEIAGTASTGNEAVSAAQTVRPDLILMDINLSGGIDGIEAAKQIRDILDIPIVYLTAYAEADVFDRAKHTEPYGYVSKPVRFLELTNTLKAALYKHGVDRKLRESEARRAKAEELADLHSWEWDVRTGNLVWSAQAYRTFGLHPQEIELTFDSFINRVHEDDRETVKSALRDALERNSPYDLEFRIVRADGEERVLHSRGEIQTDPEGRPVRMQGMSLDVTHHKKSQQALQESEERYRALFEGAAEGILVADVETRKLTFANPAICKMFGYTLDEITSLSVSHVHPVAAVDKAIRHFDAIGRNECLRADDVPCLRKDGTVFYADITGTSVIMGRRKMNVGFFTDITDRKKMEDSLRINEERFRSLIDQAADSIAVHDADGRFLEVNRQMCASLGYTREELLSMSVNDIDPDFGPSRKAADNWQELPATFQARHRRKDGTMFPVEVRVGHVEYGDSKVLLGTARDLTDRQKAEEALRESENRFRIIAEAVTDVLWMADLEITHLYYVSPAYERVWGRSLASLYENPRSFIDAVHEEDRDRVIAELESRRRGEPFKHEYRIVRLDGETRWILSRGFPVSDESGSTTMYAGISRDITESKKSEEALQKSEALLDSIIEQSPFSMWISDDQGTLIKINPACKRWVRVADEDVIGKYNVLKDEAIEAKGLMPAVRRVFENGELANFELYWDSRLVKHLKHKEDFQLILDVTIFPVKDTAGKITNVVCQHIDITDRKQAEEELRIAEQRYRSLIEASFDGIFLQKGTKIVFANSRLCELLGYERSELEGMDHWLVYHPEYQDITRYRAQARMRGENVPAQYEVILQRKDGTSFHGELLAKAVEVTGEPGVQVWVRDITARREAEQELRRSEERYRTLFEESKDGIFLTTDDGRVLDANQSLVDMLGYTRDELLGINIVQAYADPSDREKYRIAIEEAGSVKDYPIRFRTRDGREIMCLETASVRLGSDGAVAGYQGIIRDVSEQAHLQEQLIQAQKMEAVGTLAGGVAHDFNNILQVALGYSQLILGDEDLPQRYRPDLQQINEAVTRGADLVQRLLTFSRKTPSNPQPLSVNQRIREMGKMLERTIPKMIDIQFLLDEDLETINADPTQLDQVLMNLAVNARDAMPNGGKLLIGTANVFLDEEYARKHFPAKRGKYVLLSVTDTGTGMDKYTLEHIFEPFYTTKEAGQGTGLGLAVVHGIVEQHGGFIRCYSEAALGTTFKVYFPALISDRESGEKTAYVWPRGGSETILLADDDEMVRDLCLKILTRAGYSVVTASSGKEALEIYLKQGQKIALVVLDLIMPGMSGKQCLEDLLGVDPSIKVVIASGYLDNDLAKSVLSGGAKGFISKPYEIRQVLQVIRDVLDAS